MERVIHIFSNFDHLLSLEGIFNICYKPFLTHYIIQIGDFLITKEAQM